MRHILLIGGAGYIGAAITKYLLENNMKVRVLDNFLYKNADSIHEFLNNNNFSYIKGDLCKQSDIQNSLDSITDVVILGGLVGDPIKKNIQNLMKK